MQYLDQYWYNVGTARIQVKIKKRDHGPIYFLRSISLMNTTGALAKKIGYQPTSIIVHGEKVVWYVMRRSNANAP